MSHHQSHQHQPQNPLKTLQTPKPVAVATPAIAELNTGTHGSDSYDSQPSAERIRARAYEISQARKGGPGSALTDWAQAEWELAADSAKNA